ncbi:MAG: hypothetical protein PHS37_06320 [Candidatus Omnitrophica bacterium]|nr:hypothetical protein [Candidatus Omnitrophota bacterium]
MLHELLSSVVHHTPPYALSRALNHIPRPLIDFKKDLSFRHAVAYAYAHTKFYREKFDERKIDPRSIRKPSDLGDFYTTPADIVNRAEDFLARRPHIVFESSGTTGRNKRVYLRQEELNAIGQLNAMGFFRWGITKKDRFVNAFDFCIWIPGMITQKGLEASRIFCLAAGKVDPLEVYKRIPLYNINVVMGEPTWLIKLTELAEKHGSYPLKLVLGGAEEMPDAARPWIKQVWHNPEVHMVYASVESAGVIGAEFYDRCRGYHVDEDDFMVEIAEPNAEGYGEVVFTTLSRTTMPLIRYRNRDISKLIEEPCSCGIPFRKLARMRGRADELIVASGGNLYPLMFEDILKDVDGITSDWQVVFKLRGIKEVMEFNLELRGHVPRETVEKTVFDHIRDRYPDLWKNYSIAIFETAFQYHPVGGLRGNARKLLRIVDRRYTQQ